MGVSSKRDASIFNIVGVLSLAVTCIVAFAWTATAQPRDEDGEPQQRVVSIGGAVTEILYALDADDAIVGVDSTSLYPPQAQDKPDVGYMRALSAEGVLALSPDLILMEEGSGPPRAIELIEAAGVDLQRVSGGHSAQGLAAKIVTVAEAVDRGPAGEALGRRVESALDDLETDLAAIDEERRVLFILSMADGRPMAAGAGTGADAMIELAGATNVFADAEGYKTLSSEALTAMAPDVVLMVDRGENHGGADPFAMPALAATPAGQNDALIRMDALYLLGFGPRTPQAARDLAGRLYPDAAALRP